MQRGFTLIEISIVLIIIGLLVGGILAGRELIDQAGKRTVATEWESIQSAFNTYYLTYDAVAGDHDSAVAMVGADNDGNGDGEIDLNDASQANELWFTWQHLGLAGLIPGTYTGLSDTGQGNPFNRTSLAGSNAPASDYKNSVWVARTTTVVTWAGPNRTKNMLSFGKDDTNIPVTGTFTLDDMVNYWEVKYDDGAANTGRIRIAGADSFAGHSANPSAGETYSYDTSDLTVLPGPFFILETN